MAVRKPAEVLFASAKPDRMDRNETLPARFQRLLERLPLKERVKGKTVAVKMHLGGGLGYSTIHPLFVRLLCDHIKEGKPRKVFVTDSSVKNAEVRGYSEHTLGVPLLPALGKDGKDVSRKLVGWSKIKSVEVGNPILDTDVLINLSHLKAHGACGFGGACKNIAMGCVPGSSRQKMHALEGKLIWEREKCIRCGKCLKECTTKANKFNDKGEYEIFWHHCRMCMHCALVCPTNAILIKKPKYDLMQEGLARVTKAILANFRREDLFHINFLTFITIFCDCWGMTTPALVPDIGIMAGQDLVAVDQASLDAVKTKDLIPGSITPPFYLGKGRHLFEKLHARDPYSQLRALERLNVGISRYKLTNVR